jgi:hypothetical protein
MTFMDDVKCILEYAMEESIKEMKKFTFLVFVVLTPIVIVSLLMIWIAVNNTILVVPAILCDAWWIYFWTILTYKLTWNR